MLILVHEFIPSLEWHAAADLGGRQTTIQKIYVNIVDKNIDAINNASKAICVNQIDYKTEGLVVTVTSGKLDSKILIDRVKTIVPLIAANAGLAEQQRKPVDEVIQALVATGLFRAFVPRRFGGLELDLQSFIDLGLTISRACTSTGWVSTFYMEHNWMLAQFPEEAQQQIFADRGFILAPASISPSGTAIRTGEGYVLNGRWGWGTGIMHADWVFLNGMVDEAKPEPRLFIVPRSEVEVEDTWYCSGMSGTGSNDIVARDLFIPASRSEPLSGMAVGRGSGTEIHQSPCFRYPMMPLLCIAAAIPALGAAWQALELFRSRLEERTLYGTSSRQANRQSAQILLGSTAARLTIAEQTIRRVAEDLEHWGIERKTCSRQARAEFRLLVATAVGMCRDAVGQLMAASGAGAHMSQHPMQRIFRDVNTLSCHTVFDTDIGAENYGRLLLGMDPASPV